MSCLPRLAPCANAWTWNARCRASSSTSASSLPCRRRPDQTRKAGAGSSSRMRTRAKRWPASTGKSGEAYLTSAGQQAAEQGDAQTQRVFSSAVHLMENLHKVPVHLIPCIQGRSPNPLPAAMASGMFGSIYPRDLELSAGRAIPRSRHGSHDAASGARAGSAGIARHSGRRAASGPGPSGLHHRHRLQAREPPAGG